MEFVNSRMKFRKVSKKKKQEKESTQRFRRVDDVQIPRLTSLELGEVTEFLIKYEKYEMGFKESKKTGDQVNDLVEIISCINQDVLDTVEDGIVFHLAEGFEQSLADDMIKEYLERNSFLPDLNRVFNSLEFSAAKEDGRAEVVDLFCKLKRIIKAYELDHISDFVRGYFILKAISPIS